MFGRFRECGCRSEVGAFRLIATSASTAALEGEADMAGNGPKTTPMTPSRRGRPRIAASHHEQIRFSDRKTLPSSRNGWGRLRASADAHERGSRQK